MDIPGSASPPEIVDFLKLKSITDRHWTIQQSNALTGEGLEKGLKWLDDRITEARDNSD
jgi:ADP-ribosylation factor-like protein 6